MADRFDKMAMRIGCGVISGEMTVTSLAEYLRAEFGKEWIPIGERLPDKRGIYSVFNTAVVFSCEFILNDEERSFVAKKNNGWNWPCNITHWMPLPAPPKGEQTE